MNDLKKSGSTPSFKNQIVDSPLSSNTWWFVQIHLAFLPLYFFIRFFEIFQLGQNHPLPGQWIGLLISLLFTDLLTYQFQHFYFFIIFLFFSFFLPRVARIIHLFFVGLSALISYGLARYFSLTYVPLGADLFGYSWSDIKKTISTSSGGPNIVGIIVLLLLFAALYFLPKMALRWKWGKRWKIVFFFLFASAGPLLHLTRPLPKDFQKESEYFFVLNKSDYFFQKTYRYLFDIYKKDKLDLKNGYPFMKEGEYRDVLGPFFQFNNTPPNIVLVIVEGLGRSLMKGGQYEGFTPHLDELVKKSLYWPHFLSLSGRTFGVIPSILGSLPFGESGFMELQDGMPDHLSIFRIVKENGYTTRFFHGGDLNFDRRIQFLKKQDVDFMLGQEQFSNEYELAEKDQGGFTWGYPDGALFLRALEYLNESNKTPYFDVYLTLSTHEPFLPPNKEYYLKLFHQRLQSLPFSDDRKKFYDNYKKEFSTFLYTDQMIYDFLEKYKQRPEYNNTVFIITGDHRIIPLPHDTLLERFNVPFIIYSPLLKEAKTFYSVSTHLDVTPTLLALFHAQFAFKVPQKVHWLGTLIDTSEQFRSLHSAPFMRTKNEINDFLFGKYFLSGDDLYEVKDSLRMESIEEDEVKDQLQKKLNEFKDLNEYVCLQNKLYPQKVNSEMSNQLGQGALTDQEIWQNAREKAFSGQRELARSLCHQILQKNPRQYDAKALMARTYAWDHLYDEARQIFQELINEAPKYADGYAGLAQVEFWSGNNEKAFELIEKSVQLAPKNLENQLIKARILYTLDKKEESKELVETILMENPTLKDAKDFYWRFKDTSN